jgi:hypothetical protein
MWKDLVRSQRGAFQKLGHLSQPKKSQVAENNARLGQANT